jgi:hypothetical protein
MGVHQPTSTPKVVLVMWMSEQPREQEVKQEV